METIKIKCDGCGSIHEVDRTPEIPIDVFSMGCNWCPECDHLAHENYKEWYK